MYFSKALLLLATAAGLPLAAHADFMVYTEPPIPTSAIPSFANPSDAASWTTSVFLNANIAYRSFTNSLGEPYKSSSSSAASEIASFAASASNYSIPAAVTESGTTTFFGAPAWYSALPTGARQFKEMQVQDQFSIVRQVIAARQTTSTSKGAAAGMPTPAPGLGMGVLGREFGVAAVVAAGWFL